MIKVFGRMALNMTEVQAICPHPVLPSTKIAIYIKGRSDFLTISQGSEEHYAITRWMSESETETQAESQDSKE